MDIFNTVASAIDLADRLYKAIDNFQKVPERMRRLQFDVKSLQEMMHKLKDIHYQSPEQEKLITIEVEEIEKTLKDLQQKLDRQKQKPSSRPWSRSIRTFKTQLKFDDMDEVGEELQKRKASLGLTINMLVLKSVEKVDEKIEQQQSAATEGTVTKVEIVTKKDIPHMTKREFLDYLNAPNYTEDELRVKTPAEGTALWIYEREEFKAWENSKQSAALHLVGKMGSGKSVLTKNIIKGLRLTQTQSINKSPMILRYFCSCVNRIDTPSNILKGFISQFALEHEHVYDTVAKSNELLRSRKSVDNTGWSFEALWHIFSGMVQCSGLTTLYCIVDALDECDSKFLDELLGLFQGLGKETLEIDMTIKLLFSSREYTYILDSLDCDGSTTRLFIEPDSVASDIRVSMQSDIKSIQRRLKLDDYETELFQESILKKSDGMFLWVSLAAKDIMDNSYDVTFETLEELIDDLPPGLKGLYEKNWIKLIDSLPDNKLALAQRVLTWVLLAKQPLTISELTLAMAIEPGQKNVPASKKLLRNLSGFVLNYLAPFIEIIYAENSKVVNNDGEETLPSYKSKDNSKIRLVHQSAQEYLLEACNISNPRLNINLREGHELIARACLTYLCCDELQWGLVNDELTEFGLLTTTDETRAVIQARLDKYPMLSYASLNWHLHIRECQHLQQNIDHEEEDDIFSHAIRFVECFPKGYGSSAEIRQLLLGWERFHHFTPPPPLHWFSSRDLIFIVRRLLRKSERYISTRDTEHGTALHYCAQVPLPEERSGERGEIVQLLLDAGVDPNESNILGNTPLHEAAFYGLLQLVNTFLKFGVNVDYMNKDSESPLNRVETLRFKAVVEALLDAGAKIESVNLEHDTPLLTASRASLWGTVPVLIERGCNVNAQSQFGWSCLHYAAQSGQTEVLRLLLKAGANLRVEASLGTTPLHSSAYNDRQDCFLLMIENGADFRAVDHDGLSLLHYAARRASLSLFSKILELLPNIAEKDTDGWNPLFHASNGDNATIARRLVELGADFRSRDPEGLTPLHVAVRQGSYNVVRYFLEIWDDINVFTNTGYSPLAYACGVDGQPASLDIVQCLIDKGADTSVVSFTPVIKNKNVLPAHGEIFKLIMENGGDVDKRNKFGDTPFHAALHVGSPDFAKLILQYKPDLTKLDSDGYSGFHLVVLEDDQELLNLVTKHADISGSAFQTDQHGRTMGEYAAIKGCIKSLEFLATICPRESFRISSTRVFWEIMIQTDTKSILDIYCNMGAFDSQTDEVEPFDHFGSQYTLNWIVDFPEHSIEIFKKLGMKWNLNDAVGRKILLEVADRLKKLQRQKSTDPSSQVQRKYFECETLFDLLLEIAVEHMVPIFQPLPQGLLITPVMSEQLPQVSTSQLPINDPVRSILRLPDDLHGLSLPHTNVEINSPSYTSSEHDATSLSASIMIPNQVESTKILARDVISSSDRWNILVDDMGASVLRLTARYGMSEIADAVLDVSRETTKDEYGWTPGMIAERSGHNELSQKLMRFEDCDDQQHTKEPKRFSTKLKGERLVLDREGLEVFLPHEIDCGLKSYISLEGWDRTSVSLAFSVTTDAPIPFPSQSYYYEVQFLEDPEHTSATSVGFASLPQYLHHHLPGWTDEGRYCGRETSWGYHADGGYRAPVKIAEEELYGEAWAAGDTVGCGWEKEGGKIWFAKNGVYQGIAFEGVKGQIFPIVGIGSGGIRLKLNLDAVPPTDRTEPVKKEVIPSTGKDGKTNTIEEIIEVDVHADAVKTEEAEKAVEAVQIISGS